jgi:hypothetical protein
MKTFCLLWLNGAGGNQAHESFTGTQAEAIASFRGRAPGLDDTGYCKMPNGGAWCVAEEFGS